MAQYINKSDLVAVIKARISGIGFSQKAGLIKKRNADKKRLFLKGVLSLISTIEVKEVDLEKKIEQSFIDLNYHLDAYNRVEDYVGENIDMVEYERIAKYFFKLGMAVSGKEQIMAKEL